MRLVSRLPKMTAQKKTLYFATTALVAAGVLAIPRSALAVDDYADWDGVNITRGDAKVLDTGKGTTTVEQHSMRAVGEAQELHIGTMGKVTIDQNSKDALFVGRVIGDHDDPTQILGQLDADGRVMIIDRNGVFFGEGSRVDAAGIAVSTGDVSDDQIMSGSEKLTFENFGDGEIVVKGNLNVREAGLAAFVAPTVKNSGVINAKMGNVVIASGEKVTLDMYGDGLVEVSVEGDLKNALIENKGTIDAQGGKVHLSTATAKGVVDGVVNNEGLVSASNIKIEGGKIILSGDLETADNGQIDVYGHDKTTFTGKLTGGKNSTNEISGRTLELDGEIALGEGSTMSFDPVTLDVNAGEAATIVSALNNNGVTVNVEAQERINVNAEINSSSQTKTSTLNFKDEDANNDLRVDLNAKITLGAKQTLTGEATQVNVSNAGKIQNGVDVSKSGATVNVAAGTYAESVKVNKSLTLKGANAGVAGADVRGAESIVKPNSPGFLVTANDVTIDGFEIVGGNAGVHVKNANNATIRNNVIRDQFDSSAQGNSPGGLATGDGVYVENSAGTTVELNLIKDYNDDGIHARNVSNIKIANNETRDNGNGDQGIAVALGTGKVEVVDNVVSNARRDGIQLIDMNANSKVSRNYITDSKNSAVSLINITGGTTAVEYNNIIGGFVGIDLNNTRNVTIGDTDPVVDLGNGIVSVKHGVRVKNSNNLTIEDNAVTAAQNGIYFVDGIDGKRTFIYNNYIYAEQTGILVHGGISSGSIVNFGAQGKGNTVIALDDGIRVDGSVTGSRLRITGSHITGDNEGIEIAGIGDDGVAAVWYNAQVLGVNGNGIKIGQIVSSTSGGGLSVVGNEYISGDKIDGIQIGNVSNANIGIVDNDLIKGDRQGVSFIGTVNNANILIGDDGIDGKASTITATKFDGIHFDKTINNTNLTIGDGTISTQTIAATTTYTVTSQGGVTINSGNDGIGFDQAVTDSDFFFGENIINAGDNGVELFGALTNTDVTVTGNKIDAGNDGIDFDNSVIGGVIKVGSSSGFAGNVIKSVQSGVEFGKPSLAGSIIDGVSIELYDNTTDSGVHAFAMDGNVNNTDVVIHNNNLQGQQRGISVAGGDLTNGTTFDIHENSKIRGVTRDGILIQDLVYGGATATVVDNTDITGGDDGVDFRNLEGGTITNNFIHDAPNSGIHLRGSRNIDVIENSVLNNGTGLLLVDTSAIDVRFNNFAYNLLYGLHADGTGNTDVTLVGNAFIDTPVGARFESGTIDVSDTDNPNLFKISDAYTSGVTPLVGMQFAGAPTLLTIAGETLGTTIFEGYGARSVGSAFYVRFENGSILNPITLAPIVINGDFASWDGVVPNTVVGFPFSAERAFIEDRLFDADDALVNGRGQIFAGSRDDDDGPVPGPQILGDLGQFEDFFRDFILPEGQNNRASLRVLGLPPLSLPGSFNAASLNQLAPQAGATNPEALANIAPQAGGTETTQSVTDEQTAAALEPEAGGDGGQEQQVTCWGDALNSLQTGAVTYSFGGTFEDGIDAETRCQTSTEAL